MNPIFLLPVGIFGFLGGAVLGKSRKGLSMLPPERRSPLGVPMLSWEKFVTVMVVAPRKQVTPRGRWGMFGMDARRLSDVGFMTGPRKCTIGGEAGVWSGNWVAPLDGPKFLASSPAQYEAFSRSMRQMAPAVSGLIGLPVGKTKASLSGLLAVGHLAGEDGVASWVADPTVREKFRATTANFERANGIF
jgi:hypothetical protein